MVWNLNTKAKIYAIFQFLMFLALILLIFAFFTCSFGVVSKGTGVKAWFTIANKMFGAIIKFKGESVNEVSSSILLYFTFIFYAMSLVLGFQITKFKNRTYFDTVFLMFLVFPIFANIFAFMAQITIHEIKFYPIKITKKDIENEKTRIIKLLNKIDSKEALDKIQDREEARAFKEARKNKRLFEDSKKNK